MAHRFLHRARYADYAILYRGNHQAKPFEQALREQNVPYEISAGSRISSASRSRTSSRISASSPTTTTIPPSSAP
jgi:superfamily I DNA/RNA helicase